ncbi:CGNR zinc finger domain-containing protein [Streptomyces calidiresistens]|uniref:Zinc finger CGNR domain-containing protein n=1 Tax=Streptomyces calidiresistens TaxID=1485586 RepID=A0A7W3T7T0_9ACTN|nr:ABATE domain-containing protein [Streptomyces calidiresistens]MBB0232306.1 hypothetical protein [Streptomyces calidiresistens]
MDDAGLREDSGSAVDGLPLTGEPLPLDLINTTYIRGGLRGHPMDALTAPHDLARWLHLHRDSFDGSEQGSLAGVGAEHLEMFRTLRGALRELFSARVSGRRPERADVRVVNEAARGAAGWRELEPDASFTAVSRRLETDPLRVVLGEVATRGIDLLAGPEAARVRACPAPGCVLYFLGNHPRREWCTPGCGNRVRVARHGRRRVTDADRTGPGSGGVS